MENNIIEKEELTKEVEKGIQNFLQENKINVLAIKDKLLTSTELGATQNISAIATNKLLNSAGILEENTDPNRSTKWKITEKGRQYAVTPIKFTVSIENENTIIVHLKEENPKWIGNIKEKFAEIVKENNQNNISIKDERQEEKNGIHYKVIHDNGDMVQQKFRLLRRDL